MVVIRDSGRIDDSYISGFENGMGGEEVVLLTCMRKFR